MPFGAPLEDEKHTISLAINKVIDILRSYGLAFDEFALKEDLTIQLAIIKASQIGIDDKRVFEQIVQDPGFSYAFLIVSGNNPDAGIQEYLDDLASSSFQEACIFTYEAGIQATLENIKFLQGRPALQSAIMAVIAESNRQHDKDLDQLTEIGERELSDRSKKLHEQTCAQIKALFLLSERNFKLEGCAEVIMQGVAAQIICGVIELAERYDVDPLVAINKILSDKKLLSRLLELADTENALILSCLLLGDMESHVDDTLDLIRGEPLFVERHFKQILEMGFNVVEHWGHILADSYDVGDFCESLYWDVHHGYIDQAQLKLNDELFVRYYPATLSLQEVTQICRLTGYGDISKQLLVYAIEKDRSLLDSLLKDNNLFQLMCVNMRSGMSIEDNLRFVQTADKPLSHLAELLSVNELLYRKYIKAVSANRSLPNDVKVIFALLENNIKPSNSPGMKGKLLTLLRYSNLREPFLELLRSKRLSTCNIPVIIWSVHKVLLQCGARVNNINAERLLNALKADSISDIEEICDYYENLRDQVVSVELSVRKRSADLDGDENISRTQCLAKLIKKSLSWSVTGNKKKILKAFAKELEKIDYPVSKDEFKKLLQKGFGVACQHRKEGGGRESATGMNMIDLVNSDAKYAEIFTFILPDGADREVERKRR
ncbi:hypothetical protein DA717_13225, partial [Piscirickettsiaceae bacterium NZ-RLO2]